MDKRKIVRYLLITLSVILGVLVFLSITGTVAYAAGLVDNTVSDANTYSKYPLENYQLDFYVDSSWDWLPWNWLDGIGKSIQYGLYAITNFVWTVSLYISNATGYVVQEAYKLDFIGNVLSIVFCYTFIILTGGYCTLCILPPIFYAQKQRKEHET